MSEYSVNDRAEKVMGRRVADGEWSARGWRPAVHADLDLDAIAKRAWTHGPVEIDALIAEVRRLRDALVGIASGGCAECTSAPGWSGCPEDDACDACTARYALEASNG